MGRAEIDNTSSPFRNSGKRKSYGLLILRPEDAPAKPRSEGLRPLTPPRRIQNTRSLLMRQRRIMCIKSPLSESKLTLVLRLLRAEHNPSEARSEGVLTP